MLGTSPARHPARVFALPLIVGFGLVMAWRAGPAPAQPAGSTRLCALSDDDTKKAINAFDRMMAVFHHPRCANCHNAIDPLTAQGHVDLRDELRPYRDRDALAGRMPNRSAEVIDKTHRVILRLTDDATGAGRTRPFTQTERTDLMFGGVCSICHDPPAQTLTWRMAPLADSFHDKDRVQLCRHMHTGDFTKSAAEFLKHMQHDSSGFIPVGFAGTRGLNGYGQDVYTALRSKPYAPEPLTSPGFAEMIKAAHDWVDAQGGEFPPNDECGCRPFQYKFRVRQQAAMRLVMPGATAANRGVSEFEVPITFAASGEFDGQATVPLRMAQETAAGGVACTSETNAEITLRIRGRVEGTGRMPLIVDLTATPRGGSMTCRTPVGPMPMAIPPGPRFESGRNTSMQAEVGATGRVEMIQDPVQSYTFDMTLVEVRP